MDIITFAVESPIWTAAVVILVFVWRTMGQGISRSESFRFLGWLFGSTVIFVAAAFAIQGWRIASLGGSSDALTFVVLGNASVSAGLLLGTMIWCIRSR